MNLAKILKTILAISCPELPATLKVTEEEKQEPQQRRGHWKHWASFLGRSYCHQQPQLQNLPDTESEKLALETGWNKGLSSSNTNKNRSCRHQVLAEALFPFSCYNIWHYNTKNVKELLQAVGICSENLWTSKSYEEDLDTGWKCVWKE